MLENVNIKEKLDVERGRCNEEALLEEVHQLLAEPTPNQKIANRIVNPQHQLPNQFNFDLLDASRIYHISQIGKICIDYRLRFLDAKLFKGDIPKEAYQEIASLEAKHATEINQFKMIAPAKLFKLENADDPILLASLGNDYYYFIHQWGNDLHSLRKIIMWPLKTFENFMITLFALSALVTFLVPSGLLSENSTTEKLMLFMFMIKWMGTIALYYGFAKGKNFSSAIWQSKYYNA
ncbi:hypothetical protein [Psychroflexus maritimus]|uniref:Uncharacterized protein n=1 Tax=Psychroflexus maritimus TaxID=2714865 RepID=A0A967ABS8_9FLAO|nr:hypothetical protein [Psychroflexus maritimus]NGZ88735.1 hypothetical protein [Psychroflexus maritimus]